MNKRIWMIFFSILLASYQVVAQVSHVSINKRMFSLGQHPSLQINIVADTKDMARLAFVVKQSDSKEKLMVKQLHNYLLLLNGVEDVTDKAAVLVVNQYQIDRWQPIFTIPLFEEGTKSRHKAKLSKNTVAPSKKASGLSKDISMLKPALIVKEPTTLAKPKSIPILAKPAVNTSQAEASSDSEKLKLSHDDSVLKINNAAPLSVKVKSMPNCKLEYTGKETLWSLGNQYAKQWKISTYGAILAIFEANIKAFNKRSINGLRADSELFCPSKEMVQKYRDTLTARSLFDSL